MIGLPQNDLAHIIWCVSLGFKTDDLMVSKYCEILVLGMETIEEVVGRAISALGKVIELIVCCEFCPIGNRVGNLAFPIVTLECIV